MTVLYTYIYYNLERDIVLTHWSPYVYQIMFFVCVCVYVLVMKIFCSTIKMKNEIILILCLTIIILPHIFFNYTFHIIF